MNVYVYYRIDPLQAARAAVRVDALLDTLIPYCSQAPRRLHRCDDPATWMEIYEGVADLAAFVAALDVAVSGLGCATFIQGERHLECFSAAVTAP